MSSKPDPTTPGYYKPEHTALLLMDYHALVIEILGDTKGPATVKVASDMRTWAHRLGIQVIHCLIDTDRRPFASCKEYAMFEQVGEKLRSHGAEPAELCEGGKDVTFLRRPGHISVLRSPGLNEYLQKQEIKSLILTGLSTSGCVLRTAVAATDAEYVVSIISDGCADRADEIHEVLMRSVLSQTAYVTTSTEFCEGYSKGT